MRFTEFLVGAGLSMVLLAGCAGGTSSPFGSTSEAVNKQADEAMYKPVEYANASKRGPVLVVIPGKIKSNNASFKQKITTNNIADFGEMELSNANFRVLERADLGPMLDEVALAASMGDKKSLRKFKRGKFKTTRWFVKFDVLKAEPVASASRGFDGAFLGSIIGIASGGSKGGRIADTAVSSASVKETSGIWIVGMRYKVIDARTSEQVASGYFEDKMEIGASGGSFMGVSSSSSKTITLDTLAQRLVQKCVQDIDKKHK